MIVESPAVKEAVEGAQRMGRRDAVKKVASLVLTEHTNCHAVLKGMKVHADLCGSSSTIFVVHQGGTLFLFRKDTEAEVLALLEGLKPKEGKGTPRTTLIKMARQRLVQVKRSCDDRNKSIAEKLAKNDPWANGRSPLLFPEDVTRESILALFDAFRKLEQSGGWGLKDNIDKLRDYLKREDVTDDIIVEAGNLVMVAEIMER